MYDDRVAGSHRKAIFIGRRSTRTPYVYAAPAQRFYPCASVSHTPRRMLAKFATGVDCIVSRPESVTGASGMHSSSFSGPVQPLQSRVCMGIKYGKPV